MHQIINKENSRPFRLAVLNTHPIQYFAPLYRHIDRSGRIDLTVFFCSRQGVSPGFVDQGFKREVIWDTPLLQGYKHVFLKNLLGDRGVKGFFSCINLGIIPALMRGQYDALIVHGNTPFANWLAIVAAKLVGTAVFMRGETHLQLDRTPVRLFVRRQILRLLYQACDAFLYIGTRNKEFYLAHGIPPSKLFRVPYSVDNDFFFDAVHNSGSSQRLRTQLGLARTSQ